MQVCIGVGAEQRQKRQSGCGWGQRWLGVGREVEGRSYHDNLGRREPTLTDMVTPKENLHDSIETGDFLNKIQDSYSKHSAWKNVLENPNLFPTFRVKSGFILHLNDLGEPCLVLPEVIHKGERITGIMIENAHEILGHLGFQKMLEYI